MHIGGNSGGTKRSIPDGIEQTRPQQPAARMQLDPASPEGIHAKLMSSFKQPPLQGTQLARLLSDLSQGYLANYPRHTQAYIDVLLMQEEFAAFTALVNRLKDLEESQAPHEGRPFTRTLVLHIPLHWAPADTQGLAEALRGLRVTRVEVNHDAGSPRLEAAPKALSACLETLLLAGNMTELVINKVLSEPESLAHAFAKSRLTSVEILQNFSGTRELQANEMVTAAALLDGLASCGTLKHLALGHGELVTLHPCIQAWIGNADAPRLESIHLWNRWPLPERHRQYPVDLEFIHTHFDAFMLTIARIQTLQEIAARVDHASVQDLETQVLVPLRGHPALKRLDINTDVSDGCLVRTIENLETLLRVFRFSVTCPSLRHFAWRTGRLDADGADLEIEDYVDLVKSSNPGLETLDILAQLAISEEIKTLMTSTGFRLESLVFHGVTCFPGVWNAFFGVFATNRTVRHLDLLDCFMPLDAIRTFLEALQQNATLITGRLPDNYLDYLVLGAGKDPKMYGFKRADNYLSYKPVHDFKLRLLHDDVKVNEDDNDGKRRRLIDPIVREEANRAFEPYRQFASTMYTAFYDRLADNRRWQLTLPLGAVMQSFIASTELGSIFNRDVAQSLVRSLANAGAWPTLVHLSEVNKATASHGIQHGALRQELVTQVEMERRAMRMPSQARMASEEFVDFGLTYAATSTVLEHDRFDAVRAELRRGLTDSDGGIADVAASASVREALRIAKATAAVRAAAARAGDGDARFEDE
ncbi:hypothetical protein [Hydrogenophaga sp.]|uniref:hypothetical protein n=1 Tax=Hydrogenophaga sp. TaxID=1904254 RepID=UPI002722B985|nr:hypothetical protein [Hydrogenophaga sp.]MDO9436827.1 hypothetical protein [Hydrogenophaga sp.]